MNEALRGIQIGVIRSYMKWEARKGGLDIFISTRRRGPLSQKAFEKQMIIPHFKKLWRFHIKLNLFDWGQTDENNP